MTKSGREEKLYQQELMMEVLVGTIGLLCRKCRPTVLYVALYREAVTQTVVITLKVSWCLSNVG